MTSLIILIALAAVAVGVAVFAVVTERQRRTVLDRTGMAGTGARVQEQSILIGGRGRPTSFTEIVRRVVPSSWLTDEKLQSKLVQAGADTPTAPVTYAALRMGTLVTIPMLAFLVAPRDSFFKLVLYVVGAFMFALIVPAALLDRSVRRRQERIRRSTPDALDLMVVCVEAGVSLDAAILRVSRELQHLHPDLCYELLVVNRKSNAGVARDEALRSLWNRTGVEDLRALVSSMIQSEKWGTSISTVLRVNAETLRRRRRQAAEKRAAMAPLKMTVPLVTMILPALFIIVVGPTVLKIIQTLGR